MRKYLRFLRGVVFVSAGTIALYFMAIKVDEVSTKRMTIQKLS